MAAWNDWGGNLEVYIDDNNERFVFSFRIGSRNACFKSTRKFHKTASIMKGDIYQAAIFARFLLVRVVIGLNFWGLSFEYCFVLPLDDVECAMVCFPLLEGVVSHSNVQALFLRIGSTPSHARKTNNHWYLETPSKTSTVPLLIPEKPYRLH